jgi:general secretion pathway protein E
MNSTTEIPQTFVQFLAREGLLDETGVRQLQSLEREKNSTALAIAQRTGLLPEAILTQALASYSGWPMMEREVLISLATRVHETMQQHNLHGQWCHTQGFAIWETDTSLMCCTRDLLSRVAQEVLRVKQQELDKQLSYAVCRAVDLDALYASLDAEQGKFMITTGDLAHLRELAEEGPIVELVNSLISQAVTKRASDIHIEPGDAGFVARVRVDGVMRDLQTYGADKFDATVCRIKILSQLDIAERRLPQDGRMTARVHGEVFDVRISILPGAQGESVVLRLLRQDRPNYDLGDLGMLSDHARQFQQWVEAPNGIVLVTGPTGSGKTTTLYTALDLGNDGLKKIITVEDPVEYKLKGITQLQVNPDIGYTFAAALRSILRHDPDVILIGEIRDQETAAIAVQSALTGHLVFSTLHTNSAAGAITRLTDMGVERFLLASSLRGIMAQRLVRRLCPHCCRPTTQADNPGHQLVRQTVEKFIPPSQSGWNFQPDFKEAVGCDDCLHTGYLGRVAVYELFDVDDRIRQQITDQASEAEIIEQIRTLGVRSMTHDGYLKVWQGITTVAEVITVGA